VVIVFDLDVGFASQRVSQVSNFMM